MKKPLKLSRGRVYQIHPTGGRSLPIFVSFRKYLNPDVVEVEVVENLENRSRWKWKRRSKVQVPSTFLIAPEILPEYSLSATKWKDAFNASMEELVSQETPKLVKREVQAAIRPVILEVGQTWVNKKNGIRIKIVELRKSTSEVVYRQNRLEHTSYQSELRKLLTKDFEQQVDPLHFKTAMRLLRDWLPLGIAVLVESWLASKVNLLTGETTVNDVPKQVTLLEKWSESLSSVENEEELGLLLEVITKAEVDSGRDNSEFDHNAWLEAWRRR